MEATQRQTVTVEEFGRILGIGRNSAYMAVERGDVRSVRIGRRIVVPRREVERLLAAGTNTGAKV